MSETFFRQAVPVWGRQELNCHLVFTATAPEGATLRLAAADFYKVYNNGQVIGFGPARAAKGYARVDEYTVSGSVRIEVAGYHCYSLSTVYQDSFLCAEIVADGAVVAVTGKGGFAAFRNGTHRQRVERYSLQRHFTEIYDEGRADEPITVSPLAAPVFLPRRVPMPDLSVQAFDRLVKGRFTVGEERRRNAYTQSILVEKNWGKFPEQEIVDTPFRLVDAMHLEKTGDGQLPVTLAAGEWVMFDCGVVESGFPYLRALAHTDARVLLAVCEYCEDTFAFVPKMNSQGVVQYELPAGVVCERESFDVMNFRKLAVLVTAGEITLEAVGLRRFARNMQGAKRKQFADACLQGVYDAAVRTFAHNAVDIFTDCPSRERAGWLCDSFFTARAEYFLLGNSAVESAFLENYICYRSEGEFPAGVLPMTYPSDPHENFKFIPQWDMWYVLQVCEYLTRRAPIFPVEAFRSSVEGVLQFLAGYENELGLLENLPSWNFVEWSDANTWTQDVNYPTNFLYAGVLEAAAQVFSLPLQEKAERVRRTVTVKAFDGEVFVDHAKREDGRLVNCADVSEACQYYAALFGKIDEHQYEAWYRSIRDGFSAYSKPMCRINAFIGMYLRMWTLARLGDRELLMENIRHFFGGMSEKTGTLWEYKTMTNSLDHGFASFVATLM